jgi:hypothetical protein
MAEAVKTESRLARRRMIQNQILCGCRRAAPAAQWRHGPTSNLPHFGQLIIRTLRRLRQRRHKNDERNLGKRSRPTAALATERADNNAPRRSGASMRGVETRA